MNSPSTNSPSTNSAPADGSPPVEKFRGANLSRILFGVIFFGVFIYYDLKTMYIFAAAHIFFAFAWMGLIEFEVFLESKHPWSGYIPATVYLLWITMQVYVTGNISSFMIVGYFVSIALSSMTEDRNYGLYNAILSSFMYTAVGWLVFFGVIANINIIMDPITLNAQAVLLSSGSMFLCFLLVNRIVSSLFQKLKKEIEERKAAQQRILRDLDMARKVQENIIPAGNQFPARKELSFGSRYLALEGVGGDLYDVIALDDNRFGFVMADVSGHGVPAALVTTMAKVAFTGAATGENSPGDICRAVNREMFRFIGDMVYYLTAYFCIVDLNKGTIEFSNAGHHAALLLRDGELRELDTRESFYIGMLEDFEYETSSLELREGDRIILFTDGILEARNAAGDLYGEGPFEKFIPGAADLGPGEFVNRLLEDVGRFTGERPVDDDQAILCIDYLSK